MRMTCGFSRDVAVGDDGRQRLADARLRGGVGDQHHGHDAVVGTVGGAARCSPAKFRDPPCAGRSPPPRRCGCAPPAGCNSRPRGAASAISPRSPDDRPAGRTAPSGCRARCRRCRRPRPTPSPCRRPRGRPGSIRSPRRRPPSPHWSPPSPGRWARTAAPWSGARAARRHRAVRCATPKSLTRKPSSSAALRSASEMS